MVDYRDDYRPLKDGELQHPDKGGSTGALIAVVFIVASIGAMFWFGSGPAPDNGTQAPAIEITPPTAPAPVE